MRRLNDNQEAVLSTSGGTSDGRFIAPYCREVVEFGPCNETIHKINECVNLQDLIDLSTIYEKLLTKLLCSVQGDPSLHSG